MKEAEEQEIRRQEEADNKVKLAREAERKEKQAIMTQRSVKALVSEAKMQNNSTFESFQSTNKHDHRHDEKRGDPILEPVMPLWHPDASCEL